MVDPITGNRIVYNGEVYNFRELRRQLGADAEPWQSKSDTEVILRAYRKWGRDCLSRLRGMFAFSLWDAGRRELFLARDRLGIKPLYYYAGENVFLFASEVRALLASGLVPRRIDATALWQYLAYQSVPAPRTMIEGVRMLPPGSWLTVDRTGCLSEGRYWDLLENASREARQNSFEENRRRIGELLRESVALHLVSDVPVAAFLSGGIDSSAVVALMREAGHTPRTFSIVFEEKQYDEARHSRMVAARFGTEHTEINLGNSDLLDQLPDALAAMDQPTGDAINSYVVSRAVSAAGIKVALSGLGGDEFFAGYPSFQRLARAGGYMRAWGGLSPSFRTFAAKAVASLGGNRVAVTKASTLLQTDGTMAAMYPGLRQVLSDSQRRALLKEEWLRRAGDGEDQYESHLREAFAQAGWAGPLAKVSYAEGRTYMHDVLLRDTDQMSMAHSLEARVPLLDHCLVEYVMGVPDAHKRANGTPKRLLVESLDGLLPDEIVHRPKQGFTLPFELWMRRELKRFCGERLDPARVAARGLFEPEAAQRLWQSFLSGRRDVTWSRLWLLVALEEWFERNDVHAQPLH
jgi:asparagine synthase (glutamine-hydrolysing)